VRRPFEVQVIVRRGREFPVLHRTKPNEVYWHVVAGAVERGETAAEAAARELAEEVGTAGVEVVDLERRFVYPLDEEPHRRPEYAPEVNEVLVDSFLVDVPPSWEPRLDREHDAFRWCDAADAAELLYWPEPRRLVLELVS
jgi:dATP pyrophosphohydrolase